MVDFLQIWTIDSLLSPNKTFDLNKIFHYLSLKRKNDLKKRDQNNLCEGVRIISASMNCHHFK